MRHGSEWLWRPELISTGHQWWFVEQISNDLNVSWMCWINCIYWFIMPPKNVDRKNHKESLKCDFTKASADELEDQKINYSKRPKNWNSQV